jgi:23S rRNA pseudouridine2605 synthase
MVRHTRESGPKPRSGQAEKKKPVRGERIAKRLARAGVASRREVERLIGLGLVAVNGRILDSAAVLVTRDDVVTVEGKLIGAPEPTRLWRYHKPAGLLTTNRDPRDRATVFEALPEDLPRVVTVGRLDLNSEGLLLLTNDGALARALELPANAWRRVYRARALGKVTQAKLDKLKDGITVEGVHYGAIEATLDKAKEKDDGRANVWITVALNEGKNREVRRVLEAIGLKVNRLLRLAYGPFLLGTLAQGEVEEVGPRVIREQLAQFIAPENLPSGVRTATAAPAAGRRPGSALADPRKKPSRVRAQAESEEAERAEAPPRRERPARDGRSGGKPGGRPGKPYDKARGPRREAGAGFGERGERPSRDFAKSRGPRRDGEGGFGDRKTTRERPARSGDRPGKPFAKSPRREGGAGYGEGRSADRPAKRTSSAYGERSARPARTHGPARGEPRGERGTREDRGGGFGKRERPSGDRSYSRGDRAGAERKPRTGGYGAGEARKSGGYGEGAPRGRTSTPRGKPAGRAAAGKPGGYKKSGPGGKFGAEPPAGRAAAGKPGGYKKSGPGGKFGAGERPAGRAAAGKPGGYKKTAPGAKPFGAARAAASKPGGYRKSGPGPKKFGAGPKKDGPGRGAPRGAKPGSKPGGKPRGPGGPRGPRRG